MSKQISIDPAKIDIEAIINLVKTVVESDDPKAAIRAVAKSIDEAVKLNPILEILDRPLIVAGLNLLVDAIGKKDEAPTAE
jgi:hypothetical protein